MKFASVAAALLFAASLPAQNVASFQVVAEISKLVAGAKTRARAVARDPQGTVINLSYIWSVIDSRVASVEFDGTITALSVGITRVRASVTNNLFAETTIQVIPARIEITPAAAAMKVGERRQFTARVLDANGKALDAPLRWQVLSGQGFNSNAGSVTAGGMVTALAEGALLVRATYTFNTYMPGLQNEAFSQAALNVTPPENFRLSRVFRAKGESATGARTLSYRPTPISVTDAGHLMFAAAFDGRANGLVLWDGAQLRLLAAAATPGVVAGTSLIDFYGFAINNQGDIAATAQVAGASPILLAGRDGALTPIITDTSPLAGYYEGAGNLRFPRCPPASDGGMAFRSNFRIPGENALLNGLFYQDQYGTGRLVASNQEPLPVLGGNPAFDTDGFGAVPGGDVYFFAYGGGKSGLFRQHGSDKPERILVTGDQFLDAAIIGFMNSNMFWAGSNGDIVFGIQLSGGANYIVRLPGGKLDGARTLRISSWNAVQGLHPDYGVLFIGAEPSKPYGLHLWNDNVRQVVLTGRTQVEGVTIDVVESGAVDAAGVVTAFVRTPLTPEMLVRFAPDTATVLFRAGDPVHFSVPDNIWGFVPGAKSAAGPYVIAGGTQGSIFEIGANGAPAAQPVYATGEVITGSFRHAGSAIWNSRRDAAGRLYITQSGGAGVVRKSPGGTPEILLPGNRRMADGVLLYTAYEVRVNAGGHLLTTQGSERGDTRLTVTVDNETRLVASTDGATTIEGFGNMASWSEQQLGDAGRVFAIVRNTQGQFGLGLWADGNWTMVWKNGQNIGRWRVSNVNSLKTVGDRFYFRAQVPGGGWAVARLQGTDLAIVLDVDETAANGVPVNSIGLYDVNARGDLLFQAFAFGLTVYGVKMDDGGGFRHIYTNTRFTAEGDLPLRLIDNELRDDGKAYLLFINLEDELVLYRAQPLE